MSGIGKQYCKKVDLIIEIVSEENRLHDIKKKRGEYERAGIPEYWIVDPEKGTITVLVLRPRKKTYVEHGVFAKGERATSKLLPGFRVDVTTALTQKPELRK
jgi:Uma2 family endonuclease